MWGDFPDALSKATGLGVFAYSRFGYGGSDPLAQDFGVGYMHDEALAVLPAVLDEAAIEQPILLGHSDGASIALIYAGGADNPRAHGLVLEAPHVFVEDISIAGIEAARSGYENGRLHGALERYHGGQNRSDLLGLESNLARSSIPILEYRDLPYFDSVANSGNPRA